MIAKCAVLGVRAPRKIKPKGIKNLLIALALHEKNVDELGIRD